MQGQGLWTLRSNTHACAFCLPHTCLHLRSHLHATPASMPMPTAARTRHHGTLVIPRLPPAHPNPTLQILESRHEASIGFGNKVRARSTPAWARGAGTPSASSPDHMLQHVEHTDLIQAGLIPEFVGRLPVIISTQVRGRGSGGREVAAWRLSLATGPSARASQEQGTGGLWGCNAY